MDCFYLNEPDNVIDNELIFWPEPPPLVLEKSFVPYIKPVEGFQLQNLNKSGKNVHKTMIEFLRTIPTKTTTNKPPEFENDRSYRHMINERLRRGKQKRTFAELHSILPVGTKIDKNSIMQTATMHLQELKGLREELLERNAELEKNEMFSDAESAETTTIRFQRQHPQSGIDSMIGALRCLKSMGLKAKRIRSEHSVGEFVAVLEIQPKVEQVVVEKAVENVLDKVDRKFALGTKSSDW